ncbi:MAG: SpoIIE family protein phosphatase, partial [Spirochaetota bacterium]
AGNISGSAIGQDLYAVLSDDAKQCAALAVREKISVYEKGVFAGFIRSGVASLCIVVEKDSYFDEWEKDLVEIFISHITTALENIYLNRDLENKVELRTAELRRAKDEIEETVHELEMINERLSAANDELEFAKAVADQDMKMAINVQANILPKKIPSSSVWDAACYYQPMAGISGDFYDFFIDKGGNVSGASLFDVSGHGIASGLITMLAKSIIYRRFRNMADRSLSEIIDAVNDDLISELENLPNFLSGVMLRFSDKGVEYVNAGHPDIMVKRFSDGKCESYSDRSDNPKGFYLGIGSMRFPHSSAVVDIGKGDILFAFSDGLIESEDKANVQYGSMRLAQTISAFPSGLSAQDAVDGIMKQFFENSGGAPLSDDITLIAIRRLV